MAHKFDQGFLTHTTTARPFWASDVNVTALPGHPVFRAVRRRNAHSFRSQVASVWRRLSGGR